MVTYLRTIEKTNRISFAEADAFLNFVGYDNCMPSSEMLRCKECGQMFDTVESLREHARSEKEEIENRNKGFSDG